MAPRDRRAHLASCGWFWVWAVPGVGFGLVVTAFGVLALLAAAVLSFALCFVRGAEKSAFGVFTGAGAVFLFIAWVQRSGEYLDPKPWLAVGLLLALTGIAGHAVVSRR